MPPGVIGTAVLVYRPHGVNVGFGFFHLLFLPVQDNFCALGTQVRMLGFDIMLLVRVVFNIEKHLIIKQMEAAVNSAHIQPIAKAGRTLANMGL